MASKGHSDSTPRLQRGASGSLLPRDFLSRGLTEIS